MAKAVRFYETGGPEVLKLEDVHVGEPGPGEVRIRHAAVGCNFADTYFRSGYYPVQPPCGIGVEGAGTIVALGAGVTGFAVGDRVAYNGSPLGAYSTERVMPAAPLFRLPDTITFEQAAASTMRGLFRRPTGWSRPTPRSKRAIRSCCTLRRAESACLRSSLPSCSACG